MPKQEERREEDALRREPIWAQLIRDFRNPDEESLPANSQLPATMTTPMAEMAVMETLWAGMIAHQLVKADEYYLKLPDSEQDAYKSRIEIFKREHYWDYPDCKKPIFAATTLRKHISLYSLSILGKHHQDAKDISQSIIESMNVMGDKDE